MNTAAFKSFKYRAVHHFFGHDDRDGLTNQTVIIVSTDDPIEAFSAAQKYEHKNEVGRYFEDGSVVVETKGQTWPSFALNSHLDTLRHGPVQYHPEDFKLSAADLEIPF